jgi:hypothetical protein
MPVKKNKAKASVKASQKQTTKVVVNIGADAKKRKRVVKKQMQAPATKTTVQPIMYESPAIRDIQNQIAQLRLSQPVEIPKPSVPPPLPAVEKVQEFLEKNNPMYDAMSFKSQQSESLFGDTPSKPFEAVKRMESMIKKRKEDGAEFITPNVWKREPLSSALPDIVSPIGRRQRDIFPLPEPLLTPQQAAPPVATPSAEPMVVEPVKRGRGRPRKTKGE